MSEAVKSTAKKVVKSAKLEKTKKWLAEHGAAQGKNVPVVGTAITAAGIVLSKYPTPEKLAKLKAARAKTNAALKDVEKNLKRKLTRKERATLDKQHFDYFMRNG